MSLAPDQEYIKDKFKDFLADPTINSMGIQGYGGQGKTYLITYLLKLVRNADEVRKAIDAFNTDTPIMLTATTNQATTVLENEVNEQCRTVYNLFGLYPIPKYFKTNGSKYKRKKTNDLTKGALIFIDESSYLDEDLYINHILPMAKEHKCKIVFVGDKYQLLNVASNTWNVWKEVPYTFSLKTTKRFDDTSDKALACKGYRHAIDTGKFPGGIRTGTDIIPLNGKQFKAKIEEAYQDLEYAGTNCRILAWRNEVVDNYVKFIRKMHNLPSKITEGDICYANGAVTLKSIDSSNTMLITSGTPIKLKEKFTGLTFTLKSLIAKINADTGSELEFTTYSLQDTYNGNSIVIPNNYTATDKAVKSFVKMQYKKYGYLSPEIAEYLPCLTNRVSINYASTIHKAQGSTYDTVFINLTDIGKCFEPETVGRILNVAYSRAKNKVYTYGELPIGYQ